ncbi:MAG: Wzz/FepE/Etk N-terminal domain-containing protein [Eubacteriales bacterium]
MNQPNEVIQDEINIRELIETLWKGKVIIAIVTVIAVLISAIASFFFIPAQYQASTSITVTPPDIKVSLIDTTISIVDYLAKIPKMAKADYILQVKSSQVLEDTIKKLDLKDAAGNYIRAASLSNAVTVTDVANTALVSITVTYGDPEKAALIANTLSQSFADAVSANMKAQIQDAADSISAQLLNEEKNLVEKKNALNEYRSANTSADALKAEIEAQVEQIADYKCDYEDTITQISVDTAALQVLENASQSAGIIPSQDYNLSIDLNTDPEDIGNNKVNISPDGLSNSLLILNISTLQTRLVSNQAKKLTLETRIPEMETSLTATQNMLTEEYKYTAIDDDMTVAQLSYNAYQTRNREATMYNKSDIGKTIITVSSQASVPGGPISPNKKKNIVIAGALGFCLSILFVLFRNYWRRTTVSKNKD